MHSPNCGLNNRSEGDVCTQCGNLASGGPADKATVESQTRVLLKAYYSARRNTIVGVLLLFGAVVIILALMSKGLPPFLAFLWTCWMFLWGMIAFAEGGARWLSSHRQIKALACTISQHNAGSKHEASSDQAQQTASKVPAAEGERPIETPGRTLLDKARSG
jgi:hypothetical protein